MPAHTPVDFAPRLVWRLDGLGSISSLILLFGIRIVIGTGISLLKSITGDGAVTVGDLIPDVLTRCVIDSAVWLYSGAVYIATHLGDIAGAIAQWISHAAQGCITTYRALEQPLAPGQMPGERPCSSLMCWLSMCSLRDFSVSRHKLDFSAINRLRDCSNIAVRRKAYFLCQIFQPPTHLLSCLGTYRLALKDTGRCAVKLCGANVSQLEKRADLLLALVAQQSD
jgi:hypothetical protein